MDLFTIEGDAEDLAKYTFIIMNVLKVQMENEETERIKKELGLNDLFRNMSIEDLMKREREDEE